MSVINGFNNGLDNLIYSKPLKVASNQYFKKELTEQTLFAQRSINNRNESDTRFINSKEAIKVFESSLKNEKYSTIYDQPNHKTSNAIAAYNTLAHQERRNEVQNLIGIDTFA
ncbi:hypothetical protein CJF42_00115 [Pseudoalteromonas sp. NBT06-2]|uniref:hypothetical protein n=1 Tax=Pseudoalteromonas sp. NBT06-2 TaxID=2025950 RepID=UPI000BA65DB3|nr:hypothetical protein [Pseudoalteromonas sp. NBT06-2]PAJ76341.1 hypothetical protein CJF42_00115 [Pseudoalteromonas sp. NBT06-2]